MDKLDIDTWNIVPDDLDNLDCKVNKIDVD